MFCTVGWVIILAILTSRIDVLHCWQGNYFSYFDKQDRCSVLLAG